MAQKTPLVLYNGEPAQLQAGDYLDSTSNPSLTNGEATSINTGMVVYISGVDTVKKAKADAAATMPYIGFVVDATIAPGASGDIQTEGVFTATTGVWDALAGTTGGLTAGTKYYVSNATAGSITATAPTTGFSQRVGIAVSTTEMLIQNELPFYKL